MMHSQSNREGSSRTVFLLAEWGLLLGGWGLWVRLFFHGPLSLFGWTIRDRPLGLILLALINGILVLRCIGWLSNWQTLGVIRRVLGKPGITGLALLGWLWTLSQVDQHRLPHGFTTLYFWGLDYATPVFQTVERSTRIRQEIVQGRVFMVVWQGYFFVPRKETYRLYILADDVAKAWLDGIQITPPDGTHPLEPFERVLSLEEGWHRWVLQLQNLWGTVYSVRWHLCSQDSGRCLNPDDFYTRIPSRDQRRAGTWWWYTWMGWTLGLVLVGGLRIRWYWRKMTPSERWGKVRLWAGVLIPLGVGMGIRIFMHSVAPATVHNDQAVPYVMAMDILEGRGYMTWSAEPPTFQRPGRPTFFYPQAYVGSHDALVTAALSWLFGRSPQRLLWTIDVWTLLSLLGVYALGTRLWDRKVGEWALWIMALGDFQQFYAERWACRGVVMALSVWTLWGLSRLWTVSAEQRGHGRYDFWTGLLTGLLLWAHFLSLSVFMVVVAYGIFFAWVHRREGGWRSLAYGAAGWTLGFMPVIVWNLVHPLGKGMGPPGILVQDWADFFIGFFSRALAAVRSIVVRDLWGGAYCPMGESFWTFAWVAGLWASAIGWYVVRYQPPLTPEPAGSVIRSIPVTLLGVSIFLHLFIRGPIPDVRYLVQVHPILAIMMAAWLRYSVASWSRVAMRLLFGLLLMAQVHTLFHGYPSLLRQTQRAHNLLDFLETRGIRSVLTEHRTAYWLMWITDERIRAAPYFGVVTRHALHAYRALQDPYAAILLPHRGGAVQVDLTEFLQSLRRRGIQFHQEEFLDWTVIHSFSKPFW